MQVHLQPRQKYPKMDDMIVSSPVNLSASNETRLFHDYDNAQLSLKTLNEFRLEKFLCDIQIKVDDRTFPCHKCVLAASIPYFRSMFSSEMKESRQKEITIGDISAAAFDLLLNFAYTSTLEISAANVQSLLYAASILQMDSVCSACQQFLTNYLTVHNCLQIRQFAQQHNCVKLMEAVDTFTIEHFQDLRKAREFLQIPCNHLLDLLESSDLHVANEQEVFETVVDWVQEDLQQRRAMLSQLMSCVRLAQLPVAYLVQNVKMNPLIQEDVSCRDLVLEAMQEKMLTKSDYEPFKSSLKSQNLAITRPRKSAAGVVFCVGGRGTTGDPFRTVESYDWRRDRWLPVTEMGVRRRHVGVVSAQGKLYAIGGHDGMNHLESAECFDPSSNQWRPVASMDIRRRGIAVGTLEGAIYAVGGLDDTTCFQTVERYDIEANRWSSVAPMNVQRGGVGVAALGKYLYAVGGNDGTSSLDSCERYDPHLNKWTLVASMAHRRAGAGVTVLDGCLYAIGGFDDNAPLNSCERFCPVSEQWILLPSMSCPRGGVGVSAMGGRIYAVGGHDGMRYLDSVEAFEPVVDEWCCVASINQCRAGAGVAWCECSVDDLLKPPAMSAGYAPSGAGGGGVAYCV